LGVFFGGWGGGVGGRGHRVFLNPTVVVNRFGGGVVGGLGGGWLGGGARPAAR